MRLSPFEPSNVFWKAMHLHMPIGAYQGSAFGPVLFFYTLSWPVAYHCTRMTRFRWVQGWLFPTTNEDEAQLGIIWQLKLPLVNATLPFLLRLEDAAQCWTWTSLHPQCSSRSYAHAPSWHGLWGGGRFDRAEAVGNGATEETGDTRGVSYAAQCTLHRCT